jgi:tetratricopeptide (TPR) repeat protein
VSQWRRGGRGGPPDSDQGTAADLGDLGLALLWESRRDGDPERLDDAIEVLRQAVRATPTGGHGWASARANLGVALHTRHDERGAPADIDEAVKVVREAVAGTASDDPLQATLLSHLTVFLIIRFERCGDCFDRDAGVATYARALLATPSDHPSLEHLGRMQAKLGGALLNSIERDDLPIVPDDVLATLRHAARDIEPAHPARTALLGVLGSVLWSSALRTDAQTGLDEAVEVYRDAVAAAPVGRTDRALVLTRYGWLLGHIHDRTGDPARLDEAIRICREVAADPARDPLARPTDLARLARLCERRFDLHGDLGSLDSAYAAFRGALEAAPATDPGRASWSADCGRTRRRSADRRGDVPGLRAAVAHCREAVHLTAADDPDRHAHLSGLAVALSVLFQHTGEQESLAEAVATHRRVLADLPVDHPDRSGFLNNLGAALQEWFDQTDDPGVLNEAVTVHRAAVAGLPDGDPRLPELWSNLANALHRDADRGGGHAALAEAMAADEVAVAALPAGHPRRASGLSNLAVGLTKLAEDTGDLALLDRAIAAHTEAVDATAPDDADHPVRSSALARALTARFELTKDTVALDRAVEALRAAAGASPPGHTLRGRRLNELGVALQLWAEHRGDRAAMAEAIQACRDAVDAAPPGHPERATNLTNLGSALQRRIERTVDETAMAEAITVLREALAASRSEALTAKARFNLADALRRHPGAGPAERSEARDLLRTVARSGHLPEPNRVLAASDWADLAAAEGDWADAAEGYTLAVELVGGVTSSTLGRDAQERRLRAGAGLASDAAACLLAAGADASEALAVVERGRGILLAHTLDRRAAGADGVRSPEPHELMRAAADGPLVTVTVSRHRCDAVVLGRDGVRTVPLPSLTLDAIHERVAVVLAATDAPVDDPWADTAVREVLGWLWDAVAEPVLSALGITGPPPLGRPLPRLWWIPTGPLSLLPLHAAGHHVDRPGDTVLDRVVSSYTPTIRALRHPQAGSVVSVPGDGQLVVVAMPRTAGMLDLPATRAEADLLAARFPGVQPLVGDDARRGAVLDALPAARWVHVACHATNNLVQPSRSGVMLRDGLLSVADIARLHVPEAELAYLSACGTAGHDVRLVDESIHVSSAFRLAGFPHVIATLWPIDDATAVAVADTTYARLAGPTPDANPARALHRAVLERRAAHAGHHPVRWAAHIHSGP